MTTPADPDVIELAKAKRLAARAAGEGLTGEARAEFERYRLMELTDEKKQDARRARRAGNAR